MLWVLSVVFWVFIAVTCPVFFLGALLVWLVTLPFDRRRVILHLYSSAWAVFYIHVNPLWRLRITGRDRLPRRGAAVLVANHASLIDILVLFGLFRPFKWVSKQEIFRIPLIGWNMRLNDYVPLVRGSGDSVRRMMAHCDRLLAAGSPVMIFPEGRRTSALPRHGLVLREHVDARVDVLPPLDPADFADTAALRDAAHRSIAEALAPR
jgi:1-acyl-sn-glycerol-3-phosphate acyltransferase